MRQLMAAKCAVGHSLPMCPALVRASKDERPSHSRSENGFKADVACKVKGVKRSAPRARC